MFQHLCSVSGTLVHARRGGDENPDSSIVAETKKLLGNSSYGYQITDRSKHAETKYLNDEKTHKAINGKMFKLLNNVSKKLYEVELAKSKIEHREPIKVGFFILQYAKLSMLELYYNFFDRFCDLDKFEELKLDTDSLDLALAHENFYDCIRPAEKQEWEALRQQDRNDSFQADAIQNFIPSTCCSKHKEHNERETGPFKEEIRCTEMVCLCSKTYCCYVHSLTNTSSVVKFSMKEH